MRKAIGGVFSGLGCIVYGLFGIAALFVNLAIVIEAAGFWGAVIGFVIFPVTLVVAPWYALIAWGNPLPLAVTYGGFVVLLVLNGIAALISGDENN